MTDSSNDRNPVELLAEEFIARKRRGEKPSLSEYTEKYPNLAADIRALFPALVLMEDLAEASPDSTGPHAGSVSAPAQLGDYRILREVGRGGMGVVYEAEQQSLGRRVALKVLPPHALNDAQQVLRFEREARAAARLHHTNIVTVYGVGSHDGTHYYVMQFIQGLGLDGVLEELRRRRAGRDMHPAAPGPRPPVRQVAHSLVTSHFDGAGGLADGQREPAGSTAAGGASDSSVPRLPDGSDLSGVSDSDARYWRSVARIGMQVAGALEYAHGQGILHRDIKPSNLLMDMKGTVWMTDFGLAKGHDAESLTNTGDIVGTIRYMAPERFQGHSDARCDVYSLGLTLYELLALRPAFLERDRAKLMQQVLHEEPPPLRKLNRAVPRDLETIVHKAMAKEPGRRYVRAAEFAEDLQRFLDDRPIRARRVGVPERSWRWCRRNPVVASLAAAVMLVTVVGFMATIAQVGEARHERDDARRQRDKIRRTLYDADMNLVQAAWALNNIPRSLEILGRHESEDDNDLRGFEWHYWRRQIRSEESTFQTVERIRSEESTFQTVERNVNTFVKILDHSPDDRHLHLAIIERGTDKIAVSIWNPETAAKRSSLWQGPNGNVELTANRAGTRLSVIQDIVTNPTPLNRNSIKETAALWELSTWDLVTGVQLSHTQIHVLRPELDVISRLTFRPHFSPDGERVAITYPTGPAPEQPEPYALTVRDTTTGKELLGMTVPCKCLQYPVFSPDGRRLAAVRKDEEPGGRLNCSVQLWDASSGMETLNIPRVFPLSEGRIVLYVSLAFSPDGRLLATAGTASDPKGTEVNLWDADTGKHLYALPEPTGKASEVVFSPDGTRLGVIDAARATATVWEIDLDGPRGMPKPFLKISGHAKGIQWLAFGSDSRRIYSADSLGQVKVWNTSPPTRPFDVKEDALAERPIKTLLSPDTSRLAGYRFSRDGMYHINIIDAAGKPLSKILAKNGPQFRHIDYKFSGNGLRMLLRDWDDGKQLSRLQMYDTATGAKTLTIEEQMENGALGISPDGKLITAVVTTVRAPAVPGSRGTLLPDGFKLWDAITGKELHAIEAKTSGTACAFSPDGRLIAWGVSAFSKESNWGVRVWDTSTGQEVPTMRRALVGQPGKMAFSPDGRNIGARIANGRERELRVWEAVTGEVRLTLTGNFLDFTFSPDGRRIATSGEVGNRGEVKLWDTATGRDVLTLKTEVVVGQVEFSPDGNRLFAVNELFTHDPGDLVQVWDATPLPRQRESDGGQ
jgi:serine/threonine protein kinase/WD40 repeat protein